MGRDNGKTKTVYESYLLRVWHDTPPRFVLEHVQTGQKTGFVSWGRLERWLAAQLEIVDEEPTIKK